MKTGKLKPYPSSPKNSQRTDGLCLGCRVHPADGVQVVLCSYHAAAPALYYALRSLSDTAQWMAFEPQPSDDQHAAFNKSIREAFAALTKAEGREASK